MRALLNSFLVSFLLVGISVFSGCAIVESSSTTTTTIERQFYPIVKTSVTGLVQQSRYYYETISIDSDTLALTRTGGSAIATGTFVLGMNNTQKAEIERLARMVDNSDADIVESYYMFDGGNLSLKLADTVTFLDQGNGGPFLHSFSPDVEILSAYIETLLGELGYGNRTASINASSKAR